MEILPLSSALGAEVAGMDLRQSIPPEAADHLRAALMLYGVLVFRQQDLDASGLASFARYFGSLEPHDVIGSLAGCPDVIRIRKEADHTHNFGGTWHCDNSYRAQPPMGAVLHALALPSHGGDTLWADQVAALDALPPATRQRLRGLLAIHSARPAFGNMSCAGSACLLPDEVKHPLVRIHPETGRETLFLCPPSIVQIVGLDSTECTALLECLLEHATREEFIYRHRWRQGDVVLWDNRRTLHKAMNDYPGEVREMLRVSIADVSRTILPAGDTP